MFPWFRASSEMVTDENTAAEKSERICDFCKNLQHKQMHLGTYLATSWLEKATPWGGSHLCWPRLWLELLFGRWCLSKHHRHPRWRLCIFWCSWDRRPPLHVWSANVSEHRWPKPLRWMGNLMRKKVQAHLSGENIRSNLFGKIRTESTNMHLSIP